MKSTEPASQQEANQIDRLALTVAVYLRILIGVELEATLEITVSLAKRTLTRACQFLCRVYNVHSPLLKLDRITPCRYRRVNQCLGNPNAAIVIDADLSDDVTRVSWTQDRSRILTACIRILSKVRIAESIDRVVSFLEARCLCSEPRDTIASAVPMP